jgi:hypothetical protein
MNWLHMTAQSTPPRRSIHVSAVAAVSLLVIAMGAALPARAAISFAPVTWGGGGDTLGWFTTNLSQATFFPTAGQTSSATSPGAGGNPSGYLNMGFPGSLVPATELLVTDAAGFTGDYTLDPVASVSFDWLGMPASATALYLVSSAGLGSSWIHTFSATSGSWESESISFGSGLWTQLGGPATTFASALSQVSLIGFSVTSPALGFGNPTDFGLDNWQNTAAAAGVPEPGEWAMIITVLGSVVITLRRARRAKV